MPENPPMRLDYNNFAKMSQPELLPGTVKDSLQVITNTWLHLLLLRVANLVMRFRGNHFFFFPPQGHVGLDSFPPLLIKC